MQREIEVLVYLQKYVGTVFGKKILSSTDCNQLAGKLMLKFGTNISGQTLRRFFGLVRSDSGSSRFTLDLLSRYCGFKDFNDFSLLYSNDELEEFFGTFDDSVKDYWGKSEQILHQITASKELLVTIHQRLLKMPLARKYFMENHPSRDLIGTVYVQYFSAYLKYSTSAEAKIFAYGFLFKGAFLQENETLMELYYSQIAAINLDKGIHVIPAGLKFGVQLLYADFTKKKQLFKKYFYEMKCAGVQYAKDSQRSVCSFECTVLELLIFTNRTKEIKFLIDHNTEQKTKDEDFIPQERKQTHEEVWKILLATAYQKLGDQEKSQFYQNKINLENLGVGWQKYYSLMFYFTELKSKNNFNDTELISKIEFLIAETHFSYYENELLNYRKRSEIKVAFETCSAQLM